MIAATGYAGVLVSRLGEVTGPALAQSDSPDPGGRGPEFGKAAPTGLVVVLLLLIATILLVRSMNRRLRNIPESFPESGPGSDTRFPDTRSPDPRPGDDRV